jgi:hypothetical protein
VKHKHWQEPYFNDNRLTLAGWWLFGVALSSLLIGHGLAFLAPASAWGQFHKTIGPRLFFEIVFFLSCFMGVVLHFIGIKLVQRNKQNDV